VLDLLVGVPTLIRDFYDKFRHIRNQRVQNVKKTRCKENSRCKKT
jgi:hypothetical protein